MFFLATGTEFFRILYIYNNTIYYGQGHKVIYDRVFFCRSNMQKVIKLNKYENISILVFLEQYLVNLFFFKCFSTQWCPFDLLLIKYMKPKSSYTTLGPLAVLNSFFFSLFLLSMTLAYAVGCSDFHFFSQSY